MKKNDLMKKFYFLVSFCLFMLGYGQSVQLYNPGDNSVYPAENYFCVGEKFNFKVDASASSTGNYGMQPLSGFIISNGSKFIPFSNKVGNNHFSNALPIGFTFSFYGKDYNSVVIGSNGRLVFTNSAELNSFHDATQYVDQTHSGNNIAADYAKLPSDMYNKIYETDGTKSINLAQIFFGYTEIGYYNQSDYNKLTYANVTYQGKKGLLISFDRVIELYSNYSSTIRSQVLLLENDHFIINVIEKTKALQNAIVGSQNETGTSALWIPDNDPASPYNNGLWNISSGSQAYEFTPNQNLTPVFRWYQNATLLSEASNTLLNFTPNDNDVLKIEVSFVDPGTGVQVGSSVSDQVVFKSLQTPIISTTSSTCAQINLETALIPDITYEWRKVGSTTVLSTTNQLSVTASGDYVVKISRNGSAGLCSLDSAPVSLVLNGNFPPFNNSPKFICKNDGSTQTSINLYDYYPQNPGEYTLRFQENGVDLPSPNNVIILNADQTRTIKVIAESVNTSSPCSFTDTFNVTFISLPAVNTEYSPANLCFGSDDYSLTNFENQNFAGKNYQFIYSVDGGVTYQNLTSVNPQNTNTVFVKIKHPNVSCETVVKLKFNFYPKVIANPPTTQLPPQCASSTQTFNLYSLIPEINPDPNVTVSFHTTLENAKDGISPVNYDFRSGSGYTTLYIRVVDNVTGCVSPDHPDITLLVYKKPSLIVNTLNQSYCQGTTTINITQNPTSLVNATPPITVALEYYSTNGTLLTGNQITNYDIGSFGLSPKVKLVYNSTCSDIIPITISFLPKPAALKSKILICSELNYSLQNFKNEVINNSANYTFTDLSGNALPANFNLSTLPLTVNYLIKDNATGCFSDPQTVTFVQGGSSALNVTETDYTLCDTDFDGKTSFNLDSKKSVFTSDASAVFEYFKDANLTQSITSNYTNETFFAQTIYVRITLAGFCPATAKINLIVNTPTKSTTLIDKYFICYGETLIIDAGSENTSWKWSTGETTQTASFKNAGNYSVELTNSNGCTYTHNFIISDENQPQIQVINQTNNSIEVIAEGGVKPYLYYFNGVPQSSNILFNPTASSYVIQVESATACLGPPKTVYFIKINNAFSPNADGINDVWKIENLDRMEQVSIIIADRNGTKVFESNNPSKNEWDGKHNNRALPTSTYWYVVSWYDPVTLKSEQRQGWILMKNRN